MINIAYYKIYTEIYGFGRGFGVLGYGSSHDWLY